jgi:hypothetical protein
METMKWWDLIRCQLRSGAMAIVLVASVTALPAAAQSRVYNVMDFGAKGDGVADDGPAIQKAELAAEAGGGGAVYLPTGTYFMNSTVVVGSYIEIYGDGNTSVLLRSNSTSLVAMYGSDCTSNNPPRGPFRMVFVNRHYNCEDEGIHLHDFEIDGSRVNEVPDSGMITFSGLVNSEVDHLTLKNTPQDALFFRNGGQNLSVHDNTILLHNLYWGNGEGINIEMHPDGKIWGPVSITNNTIETAGPNFCTAALNQACNSDADCAGLQPATCGKGASSSAAIGVTWLGGPAPVVLISGNRIAVANNHYGILCNGCTDSEIQNNVITSALGATVATGGFTGISSYATEGGEPHHIRIEGNTIEGTGSSADGRAILVIGHGALDTGIAVRGNVVIGENSSLPAIEVDGWRDVRISGNAFCSISSPPIAWGRQGLPVVNVTSTGNTTAQYGSGPCAGPSN